jgi:hypothetical protein
MLVQRANSGDLHVRQHATWGMSGQMFWKKKPKMPLEDFWVASIGEALQPENREIFESDIFYILFPKARVFAEGNKSFYLSREGVSVEQFLTFVRMSHLLSCCACAFIDDQNDFLRFEHLLVSEMSPAIQKDFSSKGVNLEEVLPSVYHAFYSGRAGNVKIFRILHEKPSEVFGPLDSLNEFETEILKRSAIFYSFVTDYFKISDPLLASLLQRSPAPSRDAIASLIVSTKRLHDQMRRSLSIR